MKKSILFLIIFGSFLFSSKAQMVITQPASMTQLVNNFILMGVSASNVVYTGDTNAIGSFTGGNSTNLGMTDGIILTTGVVNGYYPISDSAFYLANNSNNQPGDTLLDSLVAYHTYDASVLEFDLIPVGNVLEFQYVFASEEYPEWVGSPYNDVFGFYLSGQNPAGGSYTKMNIALIPGSNVPVCVNNINNGSGNMGPCSNCVYYVNNVNGISIIFDGFSTVLIAQASVIPGTTYHLKMAIADVGDGVFDSGIFLKAQSMKSYMYTGVEENETKNFSIAPNPLSSDSKLTLNLTHAGPVKLSVSDITGKVVYASEKSFGSAGQQQISLDEFNNLNTSGIFLLKVETDDFTEMQKIIK
jgi:hypothetical protein